MRFAQTVSIDFAGAPSTRRPCDSMAVTEIRVSPRSSSSPTVTSSSGANSREVFSERSSQDTTSGTEIGFGSRVTTFEMASHFEHRTTPSKTISSFRRSCLGGRGAARPRRISGTLGPGRLARPSSMSNAADALRICVRRHSRVGAFIDSNNETLMVPANGGREALRDLVGVPPETETEALLRENNELLTQLIVEVRKILREMETMNEMTRRRLPYKWIPGESNQDDKNM